MEKSPPEPAEDQDSGKTTSCSQESLPDGSSVPPSDADAWIQVEKRHRQTPAKAKVLTSPDESPLATSQPHPLPLYILMYSKSRKIQRFCFSSCSHSRCPQSVRLSSFLPSLLPTVCLCCPPTGGQQSDSDDGCSLSSSPPPALHPDHLPTAVEYFLSSARADLCFIFRPCVSPSARCLAKYMSQY